MIWNSNFCIFERAKTHVLHEMLVANPRNIQSQGRFRKKFCRSLSPKLQLEKDLKALNVDNKPWAILIDAPLVILKSHFGIGMKMALKDGTPTKGYTSS
jgi:hypothetical protein